MAEPTKKFKIGKAKNLIVLGVVGVVGYLAYKKYVAPELSEMKSEAKSAKPGVQPPDLNGPMIGRFQIGSTRSKICVSTRVPGLVYAPIASTNIVTGNSTFSSPVNAHFTRRLLCQGGRKWAELKPV